MTGCLARVAGQLVPSSPAELRDVDFGRGAVSCFPITLPDLITRWKVTQAPDIRTYVHVSGDAFSEGDLRPVRRRFATSIADTIIIDVYPPGTVRRMETLC